MKKERKTITIGLVGAGFAGNFHLNAYSHVTGVNVRCKWVVDVDGGRARALAEKWGCDNATTNIEDMLGDPEVEAVDIVTIPSTHTDIALKAFQAGKHVICEKPLTGYFGKPGDPEPIGKNVPKAKMYEALIKECEELKAAIEKSGKLFMYAENYVYTPSIVRAAEMIRAKKSKIMYMKGEESIRCSTSPMSPHWKYTGGGSSVRLGVHPLTGMLWLKQVDAESRGEKVRPVSVTADMGRISDHLPDKDKRYFPQSPDDVEDFSTIVVTFSDGTKAICMANDNTLGGVKNYVEIFTSDSALTCNITPSDNLMTYFLDHDGIEDVFISEMLKEKTGWNAAYVRDDIMRGYTPECSEFAHCVAENRPSMAGFDLAYDTIKIVYAAYISAEEGRRVDL